MQYVGVFSEHQAMVVHGEVQVRVHQLHPDHQEVLAVCLIQHFEAEFHLLVGFRLKYFAGDY